MKLNKIYIIGVSKCFSANISLEQFILKISHIDSIFARKEDEYILKKIKHENNIIKSSQIFYGSKIRFILDYITENITKKNILVLADGDPNFFGIAGTIFNNTDEKFRRYIEIFPAASYMQKGFASIGISMSDSEIISLHGRNIANLFKALYTFKNIGVYTDKINNPLQIYKILTEKGFGGYYKFHVLSELCSKNEKILSLNIKAEQNSIKINTQKALEEFNDTKNIVILEHVIDKKNNILGINDDDLIHGKGEPTKKEIRAAALSMLELKRDSVMLDAGCGSGSVSIEAAAIASEGMIYSIDKNKVKINNLLKNIQKFKRPNIEALLGDIPAILTHLKDKFAAEHVQPDSIFVGGGGASIGDILQSSFEMLKSGGIIVINCVMIDTLSKVMSYIENNKSEMRYEVISLNISRLESISYSSYFKALNQIYLIKIIRN